jgi:uncharacterized protein (TIGR02996 family)
MLRKSSENTPAVQCGYTSRVPSNAEFLDLIRSRPDDLSLRRVHADWLQSAGDPRGELISLQAAARDAVNDYQKRKFTKEAKALLDRHADSLLGPAQQSELFTVEWFCGYFDVLANRFQRRVANGRKVAAQFAKLLDHPSGVLLKKLQLRPSDALNSEELVEAIRGHVPETLHELAILTGEVSAKAAEDLYAAAPKIREFSCWASHVAFGRIRLPNLRSFSHHPTMGEAATEQHLKSFRDAEWPLLGAMSFNTFVATDAALQAFFTPKQLPTLRRLSVGSHRDARLSSVLRWPIIGQLKELEIRGARIPHDVDELLRYQSTLGHLTRLTVELPDGWPEHGNRLTEAFGARVRVTVRPEA